MKYSVFLISAIVVVLFATSFLPAVFGDSPGASVSPSNIASDQVTSITVTDTAVFHVISISVTGPDGTVYTQTCGLGSCDGTSSHPVTFSFGSGSAGWKVTKVGSGCAGYSPALNGPANTHCSGDYSVSVSGVALARTPRFTVSSGFGVPEFGLPVLMISALGMVLLASRYVISNRGKIVQK